MPNIHKLSHLLLHRIHAIMLVLEVMLLAVFFAGPLDAVLNHLFGVKDVTRPAAEFDTQLHAAMLVLLVMLFGVTTYKVMSETADRRRINGILQINRNHNVIIVLSSIRFQPNGPPAATQPFRDLFPWTTPIDGVEGIKLLVPLLQRAGIAADRITFKFSEKTDAADLQSSNVFVIGGHENNSVAKQLDYEPEGQGSGVISKIELKQNRIILLDGRVLQTEFKDDRPLRDYGLVTRGPNRFSLRPAGGDPCVVWAFEGVRHWGTLSGIDLLAGIASKKGYKEFIKHCPHLRSERLTASKFAQFVAKCDVDERYDLNVSDDIFFPRQRLSPRRLFGTMISPDIQTHSADRSNWVVTPGPDDLDACASALQGLSDLDWSSCEISDASLREIKTASKKLLKSCRAIHELHQKLLDPRTGFAVWDMSRSSAIHDENWHRRLLVMIGAVFGEPFGAFEKHGFWKSIGVNTGVPSSRVEGTGFIPLHQDFVNARLPPDIVLFRCIRSDPRGGGASIIGNIGDALALLKPEQKLALSQELLREGAYYQLRGLGGERNPFPVLEYSARSQNVRFTGKVISSMELSPLREAMEALQMAMMRAVCRHQLLGGQTLFLNQHLVCHGREGLGTPVVSGLDARYLEQAFVRFPQSPWENA